MEQSPFSGERLESILAEMAQDREAGDRLKLTTLVRIPQDGKPSNRRSRSSRTGTKSSWVGSGRRCQNRGLDRPSLSHFLQVRWIQAVNATPGAKGEREA